MGCPDCDRPCPTCGRQAPDAWQSSLDVMAILREPDVRERIAAAGREAGVPTSTPAFLNRLEEVVAPALTANFVRSYSYWARQGKGVRRERTEVLGDPAGELIARALVSIVRQGLDLTSAGEKAGRCALQVRIPADLRTFGGTLEVDIVPRGPSARVQARTFIPSQIVDWGRSKSILRRLFDDLAEAGEPS